MPDRTRPIRKEICLNEQELNLIQHKMRQLGTHNFGAYARKMLIDGYHVNIDLSDVREMVTLLRRCSVNINQIAKRTNETRSIYAEDVEDLRGQYATLWEAANKILVGLAKIK